MKLAIMQPYFLPYIGAFQLINAVDKYLVYGQVNYRKDGWFHRNRLYLKNRGPVYFYLSMVNASIHKTFNQIFVDETDKWRIKILKFFEHNYRNTPFFDDAHLLLHDIIHCQHEVLTDFNFHSLKIICNYLGIESKLMIDPLLEQEVESVLENSSFLSKEGLDRKSMRVVTICKLMNSERYINPIGGTTLYDKTVFASHGIELSFLQTDKVTYSQSSKEFIPNLSILDVISNCGEDGTKKLLSEYSLV